MKADIWRLVIGIIVRMGLMFYGVWFGAVPQALPESVPFVSRLGLALVCFLLAMVIGEVGGLRTHFRLLLGAIRSVRDGAGGETAAAMAGAEPASHDPRLAIDTLIPALRSEDADTRSKVHAHLERLTGQKLPAEHDAWASWWREAREGFST